MIERSERSETATELNLHIRVPNRRTLLIGAAVIIVLLAGAYFLIHKSDTSTSANPFSAKLEAAMKFPLYYPTSLPHGYRFDSHSITTPKANVVVFNYVGPSGKRIWLSEEARPTTFNHGKTEIVSRANNTTWLLSNTNASVPESEMVNMLKSIVPAD